MDLKKDGQLILGFIGNVRFNEINQKLIKELANDSRFHMQYFGTGSEKLEVFARENFINNITFSGGFDLKETPKYLNEIDILNNLFGNQNIALDTALSIRMYYALFLNKPLITTTIHSPLQKLINSELLWVLVLDPENLKGIGDELMDWYNNLDVMDINDQREAYQTI